MVEQLGLADTVVNALRSGQFDDARRAAHTLKSSSATLGAHALASLCQRIEDDASAGVLTSEGVAPRLDAFEKAWASTVPAVTTLTAPDRSPG